MKVSLIIFEQHDIVHKLFLPSPPELDDVLYHVIQKSKLRVLVIDGLDDVKLRRLDKVRPYPTYFSVITDSATAQQYFELVIMTGIFQCTLTETVMR